MEKMNVDGLVGKDTDCKDICVSVNAHQRRFTAEEAPHNQIDKITCPMIIPNRRKSLELAQLTLKPLKCHYAYGQLFKDQPISGRLQVDGDHDRDELGEHCESFGKLAPDWEFPEPQPG